MIPPGIKSRATVATIPRAKMAKIIAKLTTPQTDGRSSSSETTVGDLGSVLSSSDDSLEDLDAMRKEEGHGRPIRRKVFRKGIPVNVDT